MYNPTEYHDTDEDYSPHDLLPQPEPKTIDPPLGFFYHNVAKHLIKDTVRIMSNGLGIDLNKVEELEIVLDTKLAEVRESLAANPIIQEFQELQYKRLVADHIAEKQSKMKTSDDFLKPFKHSNMTHRSYFMSLFAAKQGITQPAEEITPGIPKWPANTVKKLATSHPLLKKLLDGSISSKHSIVIEATKLLAEHKRDLYNDKYHKAIADPQLVLPEFNPASSLQKQGLFTYLGIESETTSKKTGLPKWDREQVERVHKETDDKQVLALTQAFIDHSFAAIVRNNFIQAFYKYTVDNRLYGSYKLLGAKSARYTSSNPNMLNMPSTTSIFAKPIKKCFTAKPGYIVAAIDFAALEDRVIASITEDKNKVATFTEGVDGHSLGACAYFPEEVSKEMTLTGNTIADAKHFKELVDQGNTVLKDLRQLGKKVTFGLSYGAYPPKVAASIKCDLLKAEQIFDNYHNKLYPGITGYRENYVADVTSQTGRIHLGLGFYMKTDNPAGDIRTLHNGTAQFWSILTALAINKIHQLIDGASLQDDIIATSTIYDSIYFEVRKNTSTIKWLNDHIIPIMAQDFMDSQLVHNEAELEIGLNWADLHALKPEADEDYIQQLLNTIEKEAHEH